MTDFELPHGACWNTQGALAVLRTEALGNDGAVFLATHTPVERFKVGGLEGGTVMPQTERKLLEALSAPRNHAFAIVQGEPGSGKSHLIRWLAENWSKGRDIPVLLRRAEASLEGSLRGLRQAIPAEYRDVVGEIELRQVKGIKGRILDFVSNLGNSLDPDYFEKPPVDQKFCEDFAPSEILRIDEIRSGWDAPTRIVNLMSGSAGDGSAGGRNSKSASFSIYDIADLARFANTVAKTSPRAGRLLLRIQNELDAIELAHREGISAEKMLTTHRAGAEHAAKLTDVLNARRNHAIQGSLGVTADKLKQIFVDLRRALKTDDKRLVILLEDITAWEGVDDSLMDVLIDDANYAKDLCDMISVVGVTPYYYRQMKGNYVQRATHDISLGDTDEGLQDVATLRDPETRTKFVARYLRAVRAGVDGIEAWRGRLAAAPDEPVPNRCDACPFDARAGCHAAFGAQNGVGLYPFSERAIDTFFSALKRQDRGFTWKTPRGIIQGVLIPTLTRPEAFADGTYPTKEIENHAGIERDQGFVLGVAALKLAASIPDVGTRDRARRLIAFWGDRTGTETRVTFEGESVYADVPRSIFESFEIPWIGGNATAMGPIGTYPKATEAPEPIDAPDPIDVEFEPDVVPEPEGVPLLRSEPKRVVSPSTAALQVSGPSDTRPRSPETSKPSKAAAKKIVSGFLVEVQSFRVDGIIKTPTLWNEMARELLGRIDVRSLDIDEVHFKTIFKDGRIKVKGSSKVDRDTYFELPDEPWFIDGLDAYAQLRSPDYFNSEPVRNQDVIRRRVARCLRRMGDLARDYIGKRAPRLADGTPWMRTGTIAQVLAVRAWLRGDVSPIADPSAQWRAVLNGEGDVRTDPRSRVDSWDAILRSTNLSSVAMKEYLADSVRIAQGGGVLYGLADAAVPVAAIISLQSEFRLSERPADLYDFKDPMFESLKNAADASADRLGRLPTDEYDRLKTRAQRIEERRRANGIVDHIGRIAAAVEKAEAGLPPAARQAAALTWLRARKDLLARPNATQRIETVEDSLGPLLSAPRPSKRIETLEAVSRQPAAEIEAVEQVMADGERLVETLRTVVADFVGTVRSGALTLEEIQGRGSALSAKSKTALECWNSDA